MNAHVSTLPTPDGPFTILMEGDAVIASGWTTDLASLLVLVHPSLRPERGSVTMAGDDDLRMTAAIGAVSAHYEGNPDAVAGIAVRQQSGPFRRRAWDVLREVDAGGPITYAAFAARCGAPSAVRAAAAACSYNAAALFVPCHRVLRSDGALGGFRYGLSTKQALLAREAGVRVAGRV